MTRADTKDRKTPTPSEHTLRQQAETQGLELSKVRGTPNEWLLSHSDSRVCAPFTLLPGLDEVAACLRGDAWAIERFIPALLRPSVGASR